MTTDTGNAGDLANKIDRTPSTELEVRETQTHGPNPSNFMPPEHVEDKPKYSSSGQDDPGVGDLSNGVGTTPPCELERDAVPAQGPSNTKLQEDKQEGASADQEEPAGMSSCGFCSDRERFSTLDAIFVLAGIALYIADIVTDLLVGVQYLRQGDILWSIMTFVFVFVPSLVLQFFSFRWFILDLDQNTKYNLRPLRKKLWAWCQWLASHILQLGAIKRYWSTFKFGILSRRDSKYYKEMISERLDITMLRLLEAFMESAPQLVLQVYIMVYSEELFWLTAASAIVSLLSLAFSLGIYQKALRDFLPDKEKLSYSNVALIFVWRLFTITARVLAMALFASIYGWWVFVLAAAHWAVMTAWLIWQRTSYHTSKYDEIPFDAVIGIIHIFCFFNMKEGPTRCRAVIFYILIFIENTVMFGLWYREQDSREKMYGLPALVFVWGGFFVGIFFMSFYYRFYHPNGKIQICLCKGEQRGGEDEVDGGNEEDDGVNMTNVTNRANEQCADNAMDATSSTRTMSESDRYRYLFSYKWRRRIHPKVLLTERSINYVDAK
eukprot:XP_011666244.1 PREDICTED: XK-related protein 4-like [Strongylocentrotus purpuratus]